MRQIQKHIVFKFSIVILAFVLLVPSAVKFSHIFKEHTHKTCTDTDTVHIHNTNLECEFYAFKLGTQVLPSIHNINFVVVTNNYQPIVSQYIFRDTVTNHYFFLRGPPTILI